MWQNDSFPFEDILFVLCVWYGVFTPHPLQKSHPQASMMQKLLFIGSYRCSEKTTIHVANFIPNIPLSYVWIQVCKLKLRQNSFCKVSL